MRWLGEVSHTRPRLRRTTQYPRPKKGVHIVSTGTTIVIGMYDEEQEQTSGNCKRVVLAFAEYMKSLGN